MIGGYCRTLCDVFVLGSISDEFADALLIVLFDLIEQAELVAEFHERSFLPVYDAHGQAVGLIKAEQNVFAFAHPINIEDNIVWIRIFVAFKFIARQERNPAFGHPYLTDGIVFKNVCIIHAIKNIHAVLVIAGIVGDVIGKYFSVCFFLILLNECYQNGFKTESFNGA